MTVRVLFVDDEPRVLQGIRRQLRKRYELVTADGPEVALKTLETREPFAVIVSDMRMPVMNGAELLARVREKYPDTIRIMLTGFSDIGAAVDAINRGQIFRFLNKPCSTELLVEAIDSGLEQYRLVTSERELLAKTLTGSVKALIDILSLNNPVAFGRASRVRRIAIELARYLEITDTWALEIASLLSQIGLIAVPDSIWSKVRNREWLSPRESAILQEHPRMGADLLSNIPRLNKVSEIVAFQNKLFDGTGFPDGGERGTEIPLGARILKVAMDFEALVSNCGKPELACAEIRDRKGQYDPSVVTALQRFAGAAMDLTVSDLSLDAILDNVVLVQDVVTADGEVIATSGAEMSHALRMRLRSHIDMGQIPDSFRVQTLPRQHAMQSVAAEPSPVDLTA